MLRALEETRIEGVATTIPAEIAILEHHDFAMARHSTKWVEERLDLSGLDKGAAPAAEGPESEDRVLREVTAEVDGRRYRLKLWVPAGVSPTGTPVAPLQGGARTRSSSGHGNPVTGSGSVAVPMQGTIVKVLVAPGDTVQSGQTLCILEAMKMENAIAAERDGVVKEVRVSAGDSVGTGDLVVVIE